MQNKHTVNLCHYKLILTQQATMQHIDNYSQLTKLSWKVATPLTRQSSCDSETTLNKFTMFEYKRQAIM